MNIEKIAQIKEGSSNIGLILIGNIRQDAVGQAITGNVFQGSPILPDRIPEPPSLLNTWDFLNTIIP